MYYYTMCYFTCIFYAVVRQICMLFIDNKDSIFCIVYLIQFCLFLIVSWNAFDVALMFILHEFVLINEPYQLLTWIALWGMIKAYWFNLKSKTRTHRRLKWLKWAPTLTRQHKARVLINLLTEVLWGHQYFVETEEQKLWNKIDISTCAWGGTCVWDLHTRWLEWLSLISQRLGVGKTKPFDAQVEILGNTHSNKKSSFIFHIEVFSNAAGHNIDRPRSSPGPYQTGTDCPGSLWQLSHWTVLSPVSTRSCEHKLHGPQHPIPCPLPSPPTPSPIPLPTLTKYYNNDPNLRNLLSSDRIINKMMLAALWKKKKTHSSDECQSELRRCVKARRGGRPGLPVPNSPYGVCGHKATLNELDECQTRL